MYTRPDGGVSIVTPVDKAQIEINLNRQLTDEEYEAHVRERSIPVDATNVTTIEDADIPSNREFRDAWKQSDNKIDFDLEKARNIQLERMRVAREPKLAQLDKEFMLAIEKGQDTKTIADAKQKLRDITEPLKTSELKSIDDVISAFPQELKQ